MTKICYTCGGPKDQKPHVHTIREKPPDGYTAVLHFANSGLPGILGDWSCDIKDKTGKTLFGIMHDLSSCEELLRCWGFTFKTAQMNDATRQRLIRFQRY